MMAGFEKSDFVPRRRLSLSVSRCVSHSAAIRPLVIASFSRRINFFSISELPSFQECQLKMSGSLVRRSSLVRATNGGSSELHYARLDITCIR